MATMGQVTAVQLSLVCHQTYDEITSTCLFYKHNEFDFDLFSDLHTYLVAITPARANAIQSLTIHWPEIWPGRHFQHALTMLSTCESLQNLTIWIYLPEKPSDHYYGLDNYFGSHHSLVAIKGLKTFKIKYSTGNPNDVWITNMWGGTISREKVSMELEDIGKELRAAVTQPRVAVSGSKIRAAQIASGLNIYGSGRLGSDKKPSIISSRTRGQLRKQETLDELGVLQLAANTSKFGAFGDLLWEVSEVTDSRELLDEERGEAVEVYVTWSKDRSKSWEALDKIVNERNLYEVCKYYGKKSDAYNIRLAVDAIRDFVEEGKKRTLALAYMAEVMGGNGKSRKAVSNLRALWR
jgi:hypothetical protein